MAMSFERFLVATISIIICFLLAISIRDQSMSLETLVAETTSSTTQPSMKSQYSNVAYALPSYFYENAVALPSVPASEEETKSLRRGIYGGMGDKKHLGGFTDLDLEGISPDVWRDMIAFFGVKSLLDVGCGKGISTSFFVLHGVEAICVEGSHDAVQQSIVPESEKRVVEHDFSRGPWWPSKTVDAVWCVEFTEHVGRNFYDNYFPAFKKAALIFVTHSTWGGWHHVEVHGDDYWRAKFESHGFIFSKHLTERVKGTAKKESGLRKEAFNGKTYNAAHVVRTIQVFINPLVASLPEHNHLFAEPGCFTDYGVPNHDCGSAKNDKNITPLPESFKALTITSDMESAWKDLVKKSLPKDDSTG